MNTRSWSNHKIADRDTVRMMVGYNHYSGADMYSMCHPGTNRVHQTRDIIWLKKIYHKTTKKGAEIINSKPNVENIQVEGAIDNAIETEQE